MEIRFLCKHASTSSIAKQSASILQTLDFAIVIPQQLLHLVWTVHKKQLKRLVDFFSLD